ncbi:hypothetical protein FRC17_004090 [Serendipita sp. 399]|nr:hypothetical protein FRC17_004090 [Serendipita sp. 399]
MNSQRKGRFFGPRDRYPPSRRAALAPHPPTPLLPVELWITIFSYLRSQRDLYHLLWVSKLFKAIIEPRLYRTIAINLPRYFAWDTACTTNDYALYRTLKTTSVGSLIVVLRVGLDRHLGCPLCNYVSGRKSRSTYQTNVEQCRCVAMDEELGKALVGLPKLQLLSFGCSLTHPIYQEASLHSWLANLTTETLYELEIGCSTYKWTLDDYKFLSAPCMKNLKALKLDSTNRRIPNGSKQFALVLKKTDSISQDMNTLSYFNSATHDWILSHRQIKNLVCVPEEHWVYSTVEHMSGLAAAVAKSKTIRLEMLYIPEPEKWIPTQNRSPYRNLTSLGSINLDKWALNQDIVRTMRPLSFLTRLQLIEFVFPESIPVWWSDELFDRLESNHPSLSKVYLAVKEIHIRTRIGTKAAMYEKIGMGQWLRRPARSLSRWEIVTGTSYELGE